MILVKSGLFQYDPAPGRQLVKQKIIGGSTRPSPLDPPPTLEQTLADFKTHITSSVLLGAAYGTAGHLGYDTSLPTSCVAGGLVAIGGILPDVDSDNAIVLRESLAFLSAITPMFMLQRFYEWGWTNETIVFVSGIAYIVIRFGFGWLLRRLTVHRGMWHSIPMGLIAAGIVYLICSCPDADTRWFKSCAMFVGVIWHLLLDEIYSVESTSMGRMRIKRSFGTAIKFFGKNPAANLFTYALLAIVSSANYFEPEFAHRTGLFVDSCAAPRPPAIPPPGYPQGNTPPLPHSAIRLQHTAHQPMDRHPTRHPCNTRRPPIATTVGTIIVSAGTPSGYGCQAAWLPDLRCGWTRSCSFEKYPLPRGCPSLERS